ncbi:Gfo/Idh/MocA family oxidoreductase [Actinoplanes sp. M2I2]|uniref:Gfo/Idh/MocA family protein n=1 Tax=Actinoplanes sp. M2I2 TaxID=1734444 RepID=UPI00202028C8|nr:Gfo/Idh/MocA family oxidoreductase [Actinoplanes sp. M2I2]
MSDAVRFGLVGYGSGGRIFHAPLISSAPNVEFLGVVTTDEGRRGQLAEQHPGAAAFDSIAALADAGAEAVSISTPVTTHAELALEAIAHGLHVVCDKPFTLTAERAREVVAAAEAKGVLLSVYQNRRYDSDFRTLRRLIDDGQFGTVRRFESRFERWAPERKPGAAGGGTLLDFGSHLVDQALVLNGPAVRAYAEVRGSGELDDDFFLALHHVNGVESHLWGSWRQGAPGPRFRVGGTTGTFVVEDVDGQEAALKAGRSPAGLGDEWGVEPEASWGRIHRGDEGTPVRSERGRWDLYYPAFAAAVRGDGPLPVDPADVVRTMTVLDAARESARSGQAIRL